MLTMWQSCLVGFAVAAVVGLIGYLCYYYYRVQCHKNFIDNDDEERYSKHNDDSLSCSTNENEKKINVSSLDLTIASPPCQTELSAPPIHFFLRPNASRQVRLPPPVACTLSDAKEIRRCISLSPFLGQKPPSPDRMTITTTIDSRSPSPVLSKLTTSWSSWKRKS